MQKSIVEKKRRKCKLSCLFKAFRCRSYFNPNFLPPFRQFKGVFLQLLIICAIGGKNTRLMDAPHDALFSPAK